MAAFSTSTSETLVAPVAGNVNLLCLKNNFIHLIHQADLTINGKTAEDVQPYINIAKHSQMLSKMSVSDLKTVGYSLDMSEPDNWKSKIYNGSTSAAVTNKSGNGMTNNRPFVASASFSGGAKDNNTLNLNQFDKIVNTSLQSCVGRYSDTTAGNVNGFFVLLLLLSLIFPNLKMILPLHMKGSTRMIWFGMITQLFNYLLFLKVLQKLI